MHPNRTSIFLLLSLSLSFASCRKEFECKNEPTILELDLNKISLVPLDNSGDYLPFKPSNDSIPRSAIAIQVDVTDDAYLDENGIPTYYKSGMLDEVSAKEYVFCDFFYPKYYLTKKITAIRILTLQDFSANYPAGSEVSDLFLVWDMGIAYEHNYMYVTLNDLITYLNFSKSISGPVIQFYSVLTIPAMSDKLELTVVFEFDDNSEIAATTPIIYPK